MSTLSRLTQQRGAKRESLRRPGSGLLEHGPLSLHNDQVLAKGHWQCWPLPSRGKDSILDWQVWILDHRTLHGTDSVFALIFVSWTRVSLCGPCWPWTPESPAFFPPMGPWLVMFQVELLLLVTYPPKFSSIWQKSPPMLFCHYLQAWSSTRFEDVTEDKKNIRI